MPAASLSPEQKARVEKHECACGCGAKITSSRWSSPDQVYATDENGSTTRCRTRAYRQRGKEGLVRSRETRQREALREEAKALRQEARYHRNAAAQSLRSAEDRERRADTKEQQANGQLPLPLPTPRCASQGQSWSSWEEDDDDAAEEAPDDDDAEPVDSSSQRAELGACEEAP